MISSLYPLGWQHYLAGGFVIGVGVALLGCGCCRAWLQGVLTADAPAGTAPQDG